jgi:hypothetical protein
MEVSGQNHAPAALTSGRDHGTHWTGGRVGPKTGLEVLEKIQPHFALLGFTPRTVQPAEKTHTKFWLWDATPWSSHCLVNCYHRSEETWSFHVQATSLVLNTVAARTACWHNPQHHNTNGRRDTTKQRQLLLNEYQIWFEWFLPTGVIWWPRSATPDPVMPTCFQLGNLQNWFHTLSSAAATLLGCSLH